MSGPFPDRPDSRSGGGPRADDLERRAHESLEKMLRELGAARRTLKARLNPVWWLRRYPKQALLAGGAAFALWRLARSGRGKAAKESPSDRSEGGIAKAVLLRAAQGAGKALPGAVLAALARWSLKRRLRGGGRDH